MPKNKKFFKYLGWTLAVILVLGVLARAALAPLTGWAITDWFGQQGIEATVGDVSYDIGNGRLVLLGLDAASGGAPVLKLGRLAIDWSWSALADRQIALNAVSLDGLEFDIEQDADGRLVIAGIDPSAMGAAEQAPGGEPAAGEPLEWSLLLENLDIESTRICYRQPPRIELCNRLAGLGWNGRLAFDFAALESQALPLQGDGDLGLSDFEITHNRLQRVVLRFDSLELTGIEVDGSDDIGIGEIALRALDVFERAQDQEPAYIEHVDRISVTGNRLRGLDLLTIAEVAIEGNATNVVKTEQKRFELDTWVEALAGDRPAETAARDQPAAGEEQPASDADPAPPAAQGFAFAIGKLTFKSEKPLVYRDLSLKKPFELGARSVELAVENLDSREPESPSDITYQAKLDDDSLLKIEGAATPLAAKPSFDMTGEIRALDLRRLSPLSAVAIGHTIRSGQLDADIRLLAEQAMLDSEIDLTLYHLDLQPLSEADAEKAEAELGFPLNPSLSLLKNREGTIELNIPITGDLANPDVSVQDAINQALSTAITSAVLNYYTPFGLVTAADALFSLATALRFEPVTFSSGESGLDASERGDLDKIAALMQERPGIQLRLCPYTNTADREALLPETAGLSAEEIELAATQPPLVELGEARIAAVEQYLAGQEVDPARLIPCDSTHEEGERPARVEITI